MDLDLGAVNTAIEVTWLIVLNSAATSLSSPLLVLAVSLARLSTRISLKGSFSRHSPTQ